MGAFWQKLRRSNRAVMLVVCFAAGLSVACFCLGLTGSYLFSTPVGATVVICDRAAFLLCGLIGWGKR